MNPIPKNPLEGIVFETKGVPTLYSNFASPSISQNDIRVYFGEVAPKSLAAVQSISAIRAEAEVTPRVCMVMSPEFARSLGESLLLSVKKYEGLFGGLRANVSQAELDEKLPPIAS
jgi:hypothetical protein